MIQLFLYSTEDRWGDLTVEMCYIVYFTVRFDLFGEGRLC